MTIDDIIEKEAEYFARNWSKPALEKEAHDAVAHAYNRGAHSFSDIIGDAMPLLDFIANIPIHKFSIKEDPEVVIWQFNERSLKVKHVAAARKILRQFKRKLGEM